MALCMRCGGKIGFFATKYWDIDAKIGRRDILCKSCRQKIIDTAGYAFLKDGYTRIGVVPYPNVPLQVPRICSACAAQIPDPLPGDAKCEVLSVTSNIYVRSIQTFVCPRCTGLGLKVGQFLRIRNDRYDPSGTLIEIASTKVAEMAESMIREQIQLSSQTAKFQPGTDKDYIRILKDTCVVYCSERLTPGSKGWVES